MSVDQLGSLLGKTPAKGKPGAPGQKGGGGTGKELGEVGKLQTNLLGLVNVVTNQEQKLISEKGVGPGEINAIKSNLQRVGKADNRWGPNTNAGVGALNELANIILAYDPQINTNLNWKSSTSNDLKAAAVEGANVAYNIARELGAARDLSPGAARRQKREAYDSIRPDFMSFRINEWDSQAPDAISLEFEDLSSITGFVKFLSKINFKSAAYLAGIIKQAIDEADTSAPAPFLIEWMEKGRAKPKAKPTYRLETPQTPRTDNREGLRQSARNRKETGFEANRRAKEREAQDEAKMNEMAKKIDEESKHHTSTQTLTNFTNNDIDRALTLFQTRGDFKGYGDKVRALKNRWESAKQAKGPDKKHIHQGLRTGKMALTWETIGNIDAGARAMARGQTPIARARVQQSQRHPQSGREEVVVEEEVVEEGRSQARPVSLPNPFTEDLFLSQNVGGVNIKIHPYPRINARVLPQTWLLQGSRTGSKLFWQIAPKDIQEDIKNPTMRRSRMEFRSPTAWTLKFLPALRGYLTGLWNAYVEGLPASKIGAPQYNTVKAAYNEWMRVVSKAENNTALEQEDAEDLGERSRRRRRR